MLSPEYRWLWSAALGIVLFFPMRQLIWVLSVRRLQRQKKGALPDDRTRQSLKRRAGFTSVLLCLIFATLYGGIIFEGPR